MSLADRIRVLDVRTLSADWYLLKKTTFEWRRTDGTWQTVSRETYDRGNGATLLPYNLGARTVVLTRQFRFPAYVRRACWTRRRRKRASGRRSRKRPAIG